MFDLASAAVTETGNCELSLPSEAPMIDPEGKRISITVYGPGSSAYSQAAARRQNKLVDRLKRKGRTELSDEEQRAEQADFLTAITVSINGAFTYSKAPNLSGADLYRAIYMDRGLGYITEQVQAYVGDWGNFSKDGQTS